ncbi:MAG: Asp-tRNA(Asn)/Glu-tRNA(Gln) amidotransferase subunit GatC [Dehalococcoidia bacterium]|nr:Asp-tRNA(Asn)/Glu-tRNA(Gln) amidotransferase subunit GatC [Dehalococcoidia bacterium]
MSLTSEEAHHIALLARVGLTPQELEQYRSQMENILEQFQVLQQVDTEGIPPTAQSVPLESVMREDEPRPSLTKEDTMANAPRREDDYLRVRAVLE